MIEGLVLVTHGTTGLGQAIAQRAVGCGAEVIVTTERTATPESTASRPAGMTGPAASIPLDTGDPDSITELGRQVATLLQQGRGPARLSGVVFYVPDSLTARLDATDANALDDLYRIHVRGLMLLVRELAPMIADGGRIVVISAVATRTALPGLGAYAAMKSATETLARYFAQELGPRRITVNILSPGPIPAEAGLAGRMDRPAAERRTAALTAFGGAADVSDVAAAAALLLSGKAAWITGQRIEASGGYQL